MVETIESPDLLLSLKNTSYSAFKIKAKGVHVSVTLITQEGLKTYQLASYLTGQKLAELTSNLIKHKG